MKTTILSVMAIVFLSLNSFGQSKPTEKQVKKEVKKEVRMEEENGVKTLTIVTTENGKTSLLGPNPNEGAAKLNTRHSRRLDAIDFLPSGS